MDAVNMKELARFCVRKLREAGWTNDLRPHLTINLAEEAGEFAGAARRYLGMGRRTGGLDDVRLELADVVITAYVTAEIFGFDLDAAIAEKAKILSERSWRERPFACTCEREDWSTVTEKDMGEDGLNHHPSCPIDKVRPPDREESGTL